MCSCCRGTVGAVRAGEGSHMSRGHQESPSPAPPPCWLQPFYPNGEENSSWCWGRISKQTQRKHSKFPSSEQELVDFRSH